MQTDTLPPPDHQLHTGDRNYFDLKHQKLFDLLLECAVSTTTIFTIIAILSSWLMNNKQSNLMIILPRNTPNLRCIDRCLSVRDKEWRKHYFVICSKSFFFRFIKCLTWTVVSGECGMKCEEKWFCWSREATITNLKMLENEFFFKYQSQYLYFSRWNVSSEHYSVGILTNIVINQKVVFQACS